MEPILEEVKTNVQQKFNEIRAALHMREKLLLRQLEVIANTRQQQYRERKNGKEEEKEEKCEVRFVTGSGEEEEGTGAEEEKLLLAIRSFGQFQLDSSMQLALHRTVGLRNEDYIEPSDDHETMYKCLEEHPAGEVHDLAYYEAAQPEAIVVDFSRSKAALLEDNAKRSIINITLQEAKDLIRRAKVKREVYVPPLNLEELDDELESSIAEAVSSLGHSCSEQPTKPKTARKPRFKPKITINNCNGTINLRNIASLTINCASENAVNAELPLPATAAPTAAAAPVSPDSSSRSCTPSSSNYTSNASSRSQSKKQKNQAKRNLETVESKSREISCDSTPTQPTSTETHDVTCDFYNRLLNEIKKSLKEKPTLVYPEAPAPTAPNSQPTTAADSSSSCEANCHVRDGPVHVSRSGTTSSISSQLQPGKRLILKNFENLKIILEANSGDEDSFHPVQIEQWLAEIISETDLEPMQNTDILEHSKINGSESN